MLEYITLDKLLNDLIVVGGVVGGIFAASARLKKWIMSLIGKLERNEKFNTLLARERISQEHTIWIDKKWITRNALRALSELYELYSAEDRNKNGYIRKMMDDVWELEIRE